ncbi:MAG: hypothetical protein H6625_13880 [Bdellovibrionaceae bacterium]|nr:hypothetical protein [Pseudobdellovibrionaceae bacterium]
MKYFTAFLFALPLFFHTQAMRAQVIEVHHQGLVDSNSASNARNKITEQAVDEISKRYIVDLIGKKKFDKNSLEIESKIIKNYLKYIPILKISGISKNQKGEVEAEVFMKLSIDNLKEMLLRAGLLYEVKGYPIVLPLVTITDRVNSKSYSWWKGSNDLELRFVKEWGMNLNQQLKTVFREKNFFVLQPIKWDMGLWVPHVFQTESPRAEDLTYISQYFLAPIIVKGEYKISRIANYENRFLISVRLEALQSDNLRVIGEVIRNYETDTGFFQVVVNEKILSVNENIVKDLASQVVDAWQKGTFGSSLVQMTLNGPLNYRQLEKFKELIQQNVREIRGLRERFIRAGNFTFEVDSSLPASELALAIGRKQFPSYKVEVDEVKANKLALRVNIL